MKRPVFRYVPPIACDFSGASSVLFGFASLNIFYCPASCTQPIAECDEIRGLQESMVFHSVYGEVAAVMGSDKEFMEEAEILCKKNDEAEFITIVSTPVPAIVGSDLSYMAAQLREKVKKPVIVIPTTGFESYYSGVQQTLIELAKNFMEKREKKKNQVNLIGYTPLSLGYESQFQEFIDILAQKDVYAHGLPATIRTIEDFRRLAEGNLNVVLSHEGVGLAQYMEKNFQIPYILGLPIGEGGMNKLCKEIGRFIGKNCGEDREEKNKMVMSSFPRGIVIGEPLFAAEFAQYLKDFYQFKEVIPVSAYEQERKLKKAYKEESLKNVRYLSTEEDLLGFIREYKPEVIFGDPMYQQFIEEKSSYVYLPHVGLSGRLHPDKIMSIMGCLGDEWLKKSHF